MARKKWIVREVDKQAAKELASECEINQLSALILYGRGLCDPIDIFEFFDDESELSDPFLIPGMDKAVERINIALEKGEKIAVCGDYDADGITASALMYRYLVSKDASVVIYIPERLEEGYGIHKSTVDYLKANDVTLAITVDNGISAVEEVAYAKNLGIDIVLTDHHLSAGEIPDAVAVVDPHVAMPYGEFFDYSGVGVAFKLICALEDDDPQALMERYGDLVAIGTVADIVPLVGENRMLVKKGIEVINRTDNTGISALIKAAGLDGRELTAHNVAFGLSPRINAAGRMGKSYRAFKLLVTDEPTEASEICEDICRDNTLRQSTEAQITAQAIEMCLKNPDLLYSDVIVVANEGWHQGVLGIVASRLCEKFSKPAVVFNIDGDIATGSARSTESFNIFDALDSCRHLTERLGGHKKAAGLSVKVEKLQEFTASVNKYACSQDYERYEKLVLECGLTPLGANDKTAMAALELAPFGFGNPEPLFGLFGMTVSSVSPIPNKSTVKLTLERDGHKVHCVKFSYNAETFPFVEGDKIDAAVSFSQGFYKGEKTYSIIVKDMRFFDSDDDKIIEAKLLYQAFKSGKALTEQQKSDLAPTRDEVANVFRYIREKKRFPYCAETLYNRLSKSVDYAKIFVILDIMEEFHFITRAFDGENQHITFNNVTEKCDLFSSKIFELLKV